MVCLLRRRNKISLCYRLANGMLQIEFFHDCSSTHECKHIRFIHIEYDSVCYHLLFKNYLIAHLFHSSLLFSKE